MTLSWTFPRGEAWRLTCGGGQARPIHLPEYQTDVRRCRFDTLGKLTPAHSAGAPTVLTWAGQSLAEAAFRPGENSSFTEEWTQVHCRRRDWFDACGNHNERGSLFPRGAGAHPWMIGLGQIDTTATQECKFETLHLFHALKFCSIVTDHNSNLHCRGGSEYYVKWVDQDQGKQGACLLTWRRFEVCPQCAWCAFSWLCLWSTHNFIILWLLKCVEFEFWLIWGWLAAPCLALCALCLGGGRLVVEKLFPRLFVRNAIVVQYSIQSRWLGV